MEFQLQHQFSSVQLLSHVRFFATPWTAGRFNQSILKEISPGVHWKVFIGRTNAEVFIGRTDVLWKDWVFFQRRTVHWKD